MSLITAYKSNRRQPLTLLIVGETRYNMPVVPGTALYFMRARIHQKHRNLHNIKEVQGQWKITRFCQDVP